MNGIEQRAAEDAGEEQAGANAAIGSASEQHRFERVRRLGLAAAAAGRLDRDGCDAWLDAMLVLGDAPAFEAAADHALSLGLIDGFDRSLLRIRGLTFFCREHFYRDSTEKASGLSLDEYRQRLRGRRSEAVARARELANMPERREALDRLLASAAGGGVGDAPAELGPPEVEREAAGRLVGRVLDVSGEPAAGVGVVLGLSVATGGIDLSNYFDSEEYFQPRIGPQRTRTATCDADGRYAFDDVPPGVHAYLAVRLDPREEAIATRFLAREIRVEPGETARRDLVISAWSSAAAEPVEPQLPEHLHHGGVAWTKGGGAVLRNPLEYDFPRQRVTLEKPTAMMSATGWRLMRSAEPERSLPFQVRGEKVVCMTGLPAMSRRELGLFRRDDGDDGAAEEATRLRWTPEPGGVTAVLDTGNARFRLPYGAADHREFPPPIVAVRGFDGVWRGRGRWVLPEGRRITGFRSRLVERGPVEVVVEVVYTLSDGGTLAFTLTAHEGEPYLLVHEVSSAADGEAAFEFSLGEFLGGRGYLHWVATGEAASWHDLDPTRPKRVARLQEQTPWWIPPQGFGHAMGPDGLDERDAIGVFTIRRGEWVDRAFEAIASGPGEDGRELDWPHPEMVGSTISMITGEVSADDCFYRFPLFNGERRWGIVASTLDGIDGRISEIGEVQHKTSSPRLDDFRRWRLDEPDREQRPCVVTRRDEVVELRNKTEHPAFAPAWAAIRADEGKGPNEALRFLLEGDPALAWRLKLELVGVAAFRCRMCLLGREFSDTYGPVAARRLTRWVEGYDLIAASGVFSPDEERLVRRFFLLMGHLHHTRDFMNWNFNARNANFEADRVDVVGSIGLSFRGNPDADAFLAHGIERSERALDVYCTPGSGRWYENPSCYYLQALSCRLNLGIHLAKLGLDDPTRVPRLKDFLNWGIHLLTPPVYNDEHALAETGSAEVRAATPRVRLISPIGDHAEFGRPIPEHHAVMAKLYRPTDPAFADRLLAAYQASGGAGGNFGNPVLLLTCLDAEDLAPASPLELGSRRLEGFGAVLRDGVGTSDESFVLFKQGPGGYRYHRSEGSFLYFARGQPLVYDGGEAGETWRHATLSFGDAHTPLSAGHVEAFEVLPSLDFVRGVHPRVLGPGDPVALSDDCHHTLVAEAHRRFAEPDPAVARCLLNVRGRYLVVHDDLRPGLGVRSQWNLPVMGDAETGDARGGYRFRGRFGVDLQVQLPGCEVAEEAVAWMEIIRHPNETAGPHEPVRLRHLRVSSPEATRYTALLRGLAPGDEPFESSLLHADGEAVGLRVQGPDTDDLLWLANRGVRVVSGGAVFEGTHGGLLRRGGSRELVLLAAGRLSHGGLTLISDGPAASLTVEAGTLTLVTADRAAVRVETASDAWPFGRAEEPHDAVPPTPRSGAVTM